MELVASPVSCSTLEVILSVEIMKRELTQWPFLFDLPPYFGHTESKENIFRPGDGCNAFSAICQC